MIASLEGEVAAVGKDHLILKVGGVGLRVYAPATLVDHAHVGEHIHLFTHLVVRDDALSLYGFESEEGQEFFGLLLGVNGVGPRLALAILSTLSTEAIRRAVLSEQADVFSRVPGVGKRTAQKVLLHLQGRIGAGPGLESIAAMGEADSEVLSALTSLGYSVVEAQAAIQAIPRDAPGDVETRLRLALQFFAR
jgi:Holliday junction DNA helicase RuvA